MMLMLVTVAVLSCGGASKRAKMSRPLSPQDEIKQLLTQNEQLSSRLGRSAGPDSGSPPTAPKNGTAQPENGTRPAVASTCDDVCRITESICSNAERICRIAREKLPDDNWAQHKCTEATQSCTNARKRCDACKRK